MWYGWVILSGTVFGTQAWATEAPEDVCKMKLNIGPEGTLFKEAGRLGLRLPNQPDHLPALVPDPTKHKPLSTVMVDGKSAIWASEEGQLFVDKRLFGPMKTARPALLKAGVVLLKKCQSASLLLVISRLALLA